MLDNLKYDGMRDATYCPFNPAARGMTMRTPPQSEPTTAPEFSVAPLEDSDFEIVHCTGTALDIRGPR